MSQTDKKIKFILAWYSKEKIRLSNEQKLMLLNRWIKTCSAAEEYEMADALIHEKIKQIRDARIKRGIVKTIKLRIKILIRKISR